MRIATTETDGEPNTEPTVLEFPFEEIESHETLAAFGCRPATETLEIEIGSVTMRPDEAGRLQSGVVVALEQSVEDDVIVRRHDRVVAKGKMTVVNGKIAVRISERMD